MKKKTTAKGFSDTSNKEFAADMGKAFKHKKKKSSNPLDALMPAKKKRPMMSPIQTPMAQAAVSPQPMMKKSKGKKTKKKVSHVLQESSMCKKCKTSHKPGMHKDVKKKS